MSVAVLDIDTVKADAKHRKSESKKSKPAKREKVENFMNPNVENQTPGVYRAKVTKTVENPFTGEEIKVEAHINLPEATDFDSMNSIVSGNEADAVFWFNLGRRLMARQQVTGILTFDLDDEDMNEKFKAFKAAKANLLSADATPEKKKRVTDFILGEEKFDGLRERIENWSPDPITVDFSQTELKKPSGKRGRKSSEDSEE